MTVIHPALETLQPYRLVQIEPFVGVENWRFLSPGEKQDLEEATSSLLAGCPTACVFLSLRMTESLLRRWSGESGDWGQVLEKLNKEFAEKRKPPALKFLDYLREKRNAIAHPDNTPSMKEAENMLLTVITEIIPTLHKEIKSKETENAFKKLEESVRREKKT